MAQHNSKWDSEHVAMVCIALGAILTLVWLVWKVLAWWIAR